MNKGFDIISNDRTQRFIYAGILLLWIFGGLNFVKYKYDFSPFRIDMLILTIASILLLIGPIIMNRKIMWIGAFGFSLLHGLWTTYKVIFSTLVDFHRDYVPSSSWNLKDIGTSILLIFISFFMAWIIWKMKPKK